MEQRSLQIDTESTLAVSQAQEWLEKVTRNYRLPVESAAAILRGAATQRFLELENIKDVAKAEGVEGVDLTALLAVIEHELKQASAIMIIANNIIEELPLVPNDLT